MQNKTEKRIRLKIKMNMPYMIGIVLMKLNLKINSKKEKDL